jgi:predicted nucleotidyltransferase
MPFREEHNLIIQDFEEIREFILDLVKNYEAVEEIWLFGSRAQGKQSANDWDLLLVTLDQGETLRCMERALLFKKRAENLRIHLFVNGDDEDILNKYYCPWERQDSKVKDKFSLRDKITWINKFDFQYSGENSENLGRCLWTRTNSNDSLLNANIYR